MIYIIFIFIFILGLGALLNISKEFSKLEYIGFSLPVGFGIWSYGMTFFDFIGIPINNQAFIYLFLLFANGLFFGRLFLKDDDFIGNIKTTILKSIDDLKSSISYFIKNPIEINIAYIVFSGIILFIVFGIVVKAMYWPVFNQDSIDGFDLLAKLIGEEGSINNSVFDKEHPLYSVRSLYPPLIVYSLSITYVFEVASSKIIAVIYFLSIIFSLYAFIKKDNSHFLSIIGVLLLLIIPEYLAFQSLISSNTVCAVYVFIAVLSYDRWFRLDDYKYFILCLLTISFALWTRSEVIAFAFVLGLFELYKTWKNKQYKNITLYTISTLAPFILWQLIVKYILQADVSQVISSGFDWNSIKFSNMMKQMNFVLFHKTYFAYTIRIFLVLLILNIIFYKKNAHLYTITGIIFLTYIVFIFIYYQINDDYSKFSTGGFIGSGYKRGLFYFIPIICYFIVTNYLFKKVVDS